MVLSAGIATMVAILFWLTERESGAAWIAGLAGLLWACVVLSLWLPLAACAIALTVNVGVWLVQFFVTPLHAADGFLIRVVVLTSLAAGLASEMNLRRRRRAVSARRR
jgi:hypothetical protein